MPAVDPVILQLRADVKQYQNELRATTTLVSNQLDRQERSILSLETTANSATTRIGNSFAAMGQRIGAFVSGIALGAIINELSGLADASKQLDAQLKLATATFGTFGQAQEDVRRIADEARTSLQGTASLYASFSRSGEQIGKTQSEAARAVETFSKALKIGGAGTAQAESATLQLGQALSSVTPQWEELGQVFEASPRIQRLIADSMGVTSGALKQLVSDGKLSSTQLFEAFSDKKFTAGIDAEFKQIPVTFGDAMTAVENAAITTFGEFDKGGQFSNAIVTFLSTGTDTFGGLASKAEQFGIDTRAVFDGLANVFDPIGANGNAVFDALGIKIYSVGDQIASVLGSLDRLRNGYVDADNFGTNIENAFKRGLNRAIIRAGGKPEDLAVEKPLMQRFDDEGDYRRGQRRSAARGRLDASARRLEAQGYSVPRNPDGTVNEAGIVRRSAPARPRSAPKSGGASRARSGGSARAKVQDVPDVAELMKAISADLQKISIDAGGAMQTGSERLDQASAQFESIFGKEGRDYANPFAGADEFRENLQKVTDANEAAEQQAQDLRERNVYQVASLYESLFQEGTDGIWRNFKDQGLRTLALIAAQATIASFSSGGGGFGSLLGNIGKAFSATKGGGLFGRASGGYMAPNSIARVNEGRGSGVELLRMGSQGGTVIPLGATAAQRFSGGTTVISAPQFNLKGAVITRELYADMERISAESAAQAGKAAYTKSLRDAPGALAERRAFRRT